MEPSVSTLGATEHQGVVWPILQLDIAPVWTVSHRHLTWMQRPSGRAHTHHELETQFAYLIEENSGFKAAVRQYAHPKPISDRVWHGSEQFSGQCNWGRRPFAFVHAVPNGELHGPILGEQDDQMNAVNVDADEGQRAALLFDAGRIDTQPEKGMVFAFGSQEQRVPLGTVQHLPTLRRVPGVLVQEATEGTLADQLGAVKSCVGGRVEEQSEAGRTWWGWPGTRLPECGRAPLESVTLTLPDALGWERFVAVMHV